MHKKWTPYELHTHTAHSDGQFTVKTLAETAASCGLSGIAITDHNTLIPQEELEDARKATGLHILEGIEWTTFYGHMTILGVNTYVDWRKLGRQDIHKGIEEVHRLGGIVSIAHPYRVGSPLCTGCYWQYEIEDWRAVDAIEVWSELKPSQVQYNTYAYNLWIDLLNRGYEVTASYGLDWHRPYGEKDIAVVAYLALEDREHESLDAQVIETIQSGRVSISMGPVMDIQVTHKESERTWNMGDTVRMNGWIEDDKRLSGVITLDYNYRQDHWRLDGDTIRLVLRTNLGNLMDEEVTNGTKRLTQDINVEGVTWAIGELYGTMNGVDMQIGFTNPIFFQNY